MSDGYLRDGCQWVCTCLYEYLATLASEATHVKADLVLQKILKGEDDGPFSDLLSRHAKADLALLQKILTGEANSPGALLLKHTKAALVLRKICGYWDLVRSLMNKNKGRPLAAKDLKVLGNEILLLGAPNG
eukprot:1138818-Pelagomonas_calceolata.AAC.6